MPSDSAIQPLIVGSPDLAVEMSAELADMGLWIPAIRTPTVPKNSDRLRITLSATHTKKDIHALVDALAIVQQRRCQRGIPRCLAAGSDSWRAVSGRRNVAGFHFPAFFQHFYNAHSAAEA